MKKLNKKGFTIVELSIVIAVVAILSAVLIPTFSSIVNKAKDSSAVQEAKNAYTQYISDPANAENNGDFIYEYSEKRVVAINDGNLVDANDDGTIDVYASRAEALKAIADTYTADNTTVTAIDSTKLSTVAPKA